MAPRTASRCTSPAARPDGRVRDRRRAALLSAGLAAAAALAAAPGTIELPQGIAGRQARLLQDALAAGQSGPVENHAPGPITVDEAVEVGVAPDGTVAAPRVRQTLTIQGTGDYVLELPQGAVAAAPLAGSDNAPGLRQGTVLWEGFGAGQEHLGAEIVLPADADRSPVAVTTTVDGAAVRLRIANATSVPLTYAAAAPDTESLRRALTAARQVRAQGRPVRVGDDQVPSVLPVGGTATDVTVDVTVPVRVTGTVTFGGRARPVDVTLPSDAAPEGRLDLVGAPPIVPDLEVSFVLPPAASLPDPIALPAGDDEAGRTARREALNALVRVVGQSLRQRDYLPLVPGFVDATLSASFHVGAAASDDAPTGPTEALSDGSRRLPAVVAIVLLAITAGALWWRN